MATITIDLVICVLIDANLNLLTFKTVLFTANRFPSPPTLEIIAIRQKEKDVIQFMNSSIPTALVCHLASLLIELTGEMGSISVLPPA